MSIVRRGVKRNNSGLLCLSDSKNDVFVWKKRLADSENTETKGKKVIQISSPVGLRPEVYRPLSEVQHHKCEQHSCFSKEQALAQLHCECGTDESEFLARHGYFLHSGKLGSGRYCKVKLAEPIQYMDGTFKNSDDAKVAMKIIDTSQVRSEFLRKFLPRELKIWPKLRHTHLVKMHSYFQFSSKIFMVLEYVPGGDLLTFIQQNGCQPEGASRYWMLQLISAVSYMHAKGVAHRDLKLENVLIDRNGNLKITDFGFCRQMDSDQGDSFLSRTYCGSKAYSAPEILQGIQYDPFKADVWSLGVLGFILVTGRMPFNEHVSHQSVIVEAQRNRSYRYPSKLNISSHCKQTIDTMMTFDWRDRPDIFFVKNLSWIKRPSVQDILP